MSIKPPLALTAAVVAADGTETIWWSGDRRAYNRPQRLRFSTRVGDGFSDGSLALPRRIDKDYQDLELYNTVILVGDDGRIAYEGRIASIPQSTSGGHSIAVQLAGWMAHAKDRKFREIYVDRDLNQWHDPGYSRIAAILANTWNFSNGRVVLSPVSNLPAVWTQMTGTWSRFTLSEMWYDAGKNLLVGAVYVTSDFDGNNVIESDTNWSRHFQSSVGENGAFTQVSGNMRGTGVNNHYWALPVPTRFVFFQSSYATGPAGGEGNLYSYQWRNVGVYGTHGLTRRGAEPGGFYASDMLRDVADRFCPKLNTAGVENTTLVIPHAVFRDRTTPFDAFTLFNGPHGYELGVWEDKTLTFRPYDFSDYDWQVRTDQPGVDVSLQGDTTEGLANYAIVEFDNVLTGYRDVVGPTDSADLEDTTADHPANTHGLDVELTIGLTFPTSPAVAIAFGKSYLTEFNRPKNRGQIVVKGHILDNAGHWQQSWLVRYGQTISITDHPNDTPRLITATDYDHPTRTMTISTDNGELNLVEAVVDYIRTSLTAGNIA